ncbi:DinB family protein [Vibrio sp. S4M6]|uniref:DinB family protein n=1 Tax=Vibrio sinus TaxID=2946865 RepID=UPI00202A38C2|nr:DinB family protein [Vibrio sinus]MCL9783309.1 DinB family protein [Vibrio sinus]
MFVTPNTLQDLDRQHSPLIAVNGCIETLEQGFLFLDALPEKDYSVIVAPQFSSSIGQHFRHLLDIFHSLGKSRQLIDYNQRRRGHEVETSITTAMSELEVVIQWLQQKQEPELLEPVTIITEVSVKQTETSTMSSTLIREITFASLHATHHYAMAKVISQFLGNATCSGFGVAPATATFIREQ